MNRSRRLALTNPEGAPDRVWHTGSTAPRSAVLADMAGMATLVATSLVAVRVDKQQFSNPVFHRIKDADEMRENSPLMQPHGEVDDAVLARGEGRVLASPESSHRPKGGQVGMEEIARKSLGHPGHPHADEGGLRRPAVDPRPATGSPRDTGAEAPQGGGENLLSGNADTEKLRGGYNKSPHHVRDRELEVTQNKIITLVFRGHRLNCLQVHQQSKSLEVREMMKRGTRNGSRGTHP
jgi:hypothetical protein